MVAANVFGMVTSVDAPDASVIADAAPVYTGVFDASYTTAFKITLVMLIVPLLRSRPPSAMGVPWESGVWL